jgi:ligand-binding sensor domain-containing protein
MAAGGWDSGVWVSEDGGETWIDRGVGLPSPNVTAVTFDPNVPDRLWVSTFEEGTYYSDDNGKIWVDGNLYGAYVLDLDSIPFTQ